MNDEETVALIAGGHTFGKTHGAADPDEHVGAEPEGAPIEEQGLGWQNTLRHRQGRGRDHQRARGHLDRDADRVGQQLLRDPVRLRVGADQEPRRRPPVAAEGRRRRPARCPGRTTASEPRPPTMLTTDLSLRFDPIYEPISRRFLENPDEFADAFARAWFKLTHRDMGPIAALPRPGGPAGDADLAGPGARGRSRAGRRRGRRRAQGSRSSTRACPSPSWSRPRGRRRRRSAAATSAAAPTAPASGSSRRAAGRSTTPPSWRRCCAPWRGSRRTSTPRRRQAGLARRPDRARPARAGVEQAARNAGARRRGAVHAGAHGRVAGADRRRVVRRARADGGRVPQLPAARSTGCRPSTC